MSTIKGENGNEWPDSLMIRDTQIIPEDGSGRIYTTTGFGYEKRRYIREDVVTDAPTSIPTSKKTSDMTFKQFQLYCREQLVQSFIEKGFQGLNIEIMGIVHLHSEIIRQGGFKPK
jgi:hypothetical protein